MNTPDTTEQIPPAPSNTPRNIVKRRRRNRPRKNPDAVLHVLQRKETLTLRRSVWHTYQPYSVWNWRDLRVFGYVLFDGTITRRSRNPLQG